MKYKKSNVVLLFVSLIFALFGVGMIFASDGYDRMPQCGPTRTSYGGDGCISGSGSGGKCSWKCSDSFAASGKGGGMRTVSVNCSDRNCNSGGGNSAGSNGGGGGCKDSSWSPSPNTVCIGKRFTQKSNCNKKRGANGSKRCCADSSWSPAPGSVCAGKHFTQTSNCSKRRNAVGNKNCSTCTINGRSSTTPPVGATICSGTNTGLTVNTSWHKVSNCTGATKCSYTKKVDCGSANKQSFDSLTSSSPNLCSNNPVGIRVSNFNDNLIEVNGNWTWDCTKRGYDSAIGCWAKKRGECTISTAVPPGGFTSSNYSDACQHGSFNSVHLEGGILKWTCGSDDNTSTITYHIGSFDTDGATAGRIVSHDDIPPSTSCQCIPTYDYTCVDLTADCTNHCGQTINQSAMLTKKDTHCFPNVPLTPTAAEKAAHPCPGKKVQCPPCGINAGESGTINETN